MTPAEHLAARGWTRDGRGFWRHPTDRDVGTPDIRIAEDSARSSDLHDVREHGSVTYRPTREQATTSPLCVTLAAHDVTEREAIYHLHRTLKTDEADFLETSTALLVREQQAQGIADAWKALAKATWAELQIDRHAQNNEGKDFTARFRAAAAAVFEAKAALRALGIDPEAP